MEVAAGVREKFCQFFGMAGGRGETRERSRTHCRFCWWSNRGPLRIGSHCFVMLLKNKCKFHSLTCHSDSVYLMKLTHLSFPHCISPQHLFFTVLTDLPSVFRETHNNQKLQTAGRWKINTRLLNAIWKERPLCLTKSNFPVWAQESDAENLTSHSVAMSALYFLKKPSACAVCR